MTGRNGNERIQCLRNSHHQKTRAKLISELEKELSSIPIETRRSNLLLQLLEARMKNPNSWDSLIGLWYRIDNHFPGLGTILSKYDTNYPQDLMRAALCTRFKAVL